MKLTNLFDDSDDRAVSPVIGVILMVAITVILAAVIGTFVLGLGDQVETAPQASFNFDYDGSGEVTVRHRGGDSINPDNIEIRVNGNEVGTAGTSYPGSSLSDFSSFSAGNELKIDGLDSEDNIDIVYTSGDRQDIIGSFTVPA